MAQKPKFVEDVDLSNQLRKSSSLEILSISAQEASKNTALEEQKDDVDHPQSCNTDNDRNTSGAGTIGNQDQDYSDLLMKSEKDAASVNQSDP